MNKEIIEQIKDKILKYKHIPNDNVLSKILQINEILYLKEIFSHQGLQTLAYCFNKFYTDGFKCQTRCNQCGKELSHKQVCYSFRDKTLYSFCQNKCASEGLRQIYKDKTGFDHPFQNPHIIEKQKNTRKNETGFEYALSKGQISREKRNDTMKSRYGTIHALQYNQSKEKYKNTMLKKIGYTQNFLIPGAYNKIRITNIQKYGHPRGPKSSSKLQEEIFDFIANKFNGYIKQNVVLDKYDLDIYIPELKLAIEVNGDYWHSNNKLVFNKQLVKTNIAESKGIRLIHIWEHEWKNNQDFCKYVIDCYLNGKIPDVSKYDGKLPRDYFSTLDFSGCKIEEPIIEKSGKYDIYKTGYIIL